MRRTVVLAVWMVSDLLLFLAAYALAYFVRVGWIFSTDFPVVEYMSIAAVVAPLWLSVMAVTRTFTLTRTQATIRNLSYILYACIVGGALFALTYFFTVGLFFSRLLLLLALLFSTLIIGLWHVAFERIARGILRRDPPAFPTLVIGVTRESQRLIRALNAHRNPIRPVAVLDGEGSREKEIDGVPVLGKLNLLEETIRTYRPTHLIQCSDLEHSLNLLGVCRQHHMTYVLLPSLLGIVEGDERIERLEGWAVTMVKPHGRKRSLLQRLGFHRP